MPLEEGVIRFDLQDFKLTTADVNGPWEKLERWREKLYQLDLIGEDDHQIGYGNLSLRLSPQGEFLITGTQTGKLLSLTGLHYTKVTQISFEPFSLKGEGPLKPSSESITHGALYQAHPSIGAIFHVHHQEMWEKMLQGTYLRTPPETDYGTPEMAKRMKDLSFQIPEMVVMEGHQGGILSLGRTPEEAGELLLKTYERIIFS